MKRALAVLAAACLSTSLLTFTTAGLSATAAPASTSVKTLLSKLPVKSENHSKKYIRDRFGYDDGLDADGDGCITRKEILIRDAVRLDKVSSSCAVYGKWKSLYDNKVTTDPARDLQIDHLVPLAEAWYSGATSWTGQRLIAFGNDTDYKWDLQAVTASSNQAKGAGDPADWMPKQNRCTYIAAWVGVKTRWKLSVDKREKAAITKYLKKCGSLKVEAPGSPNVAALAGRTSPTTPAPADSPSPAPEPNPTAGLPPIATPNPAPTSFCPAGKLYGAVTSISADPPALYSSRVTVHAAGYVQNDSEAAVYVYASAPRLVLLTSSGDFVSAYYPRFDLPGFALDQYGRYSLQPGEVLKWTADQSEYATAWASASFAEAPASDRYTWTEPNFFNCPSSAQPFNPRVLTPVSH